ncbi:MAG: glycosyltransferase [Bacteroidales bacterium]|nr:glycosyltransferase [Bacteroidales bacterium]
MKALSFVIPAYNTEDTILRCLDSIYASGLDDADFEVVVIDDCSTDKTFRIASDYASTHSNMIVKRHSSNLKPGACVNLGVETASGQYIQFVGADDMISQSIVRALEQAVKWDVDCQLNAFSVEIQKGQHEILGSEYKTGVCITGEEFCDKVFDAKIQFCAGPLFLWKRDFIISIYRRAVEGRYYEDTDWIEYMLPRAERVTFFNEPVYKCLYTPSSITHRTKDMVIMTDYLLMQIRRLENTLCCEIATYNAKIERYCKGEIKKFLRLRNVSKYPFKQLKYLYKSLTKDNYRKMRNFDFGIQANWFFRCRRSWLTAMFFMCRPAMVGRSIVAKMRG